MPFFQELFAVLFNNRLQKRQLMLPHAVIIHQ